MDLQLRESSMVGRNFERAVKSVKRCMRKTIGRGRLTLDELQMATTEVEMIVNSCPLAYNISMESIQEAVTPSHLMTGRKLMSLPDSPYNEELGEDVNVVSSDILNRIIHLNTCSIGAFLETMGERVYLLELREAHRHGKHPRKEKWQDCCGWDGREFWKLAKVESLITVNNGKTWGAVVRVASADRRSSYSAKASTSAPIPTRD